jgi:hypothetical protein
MTETPQDFDFDKWLDDAERPQRSVTVYQKSGLIADLDALEARILAAEDDEDVDGPSMAGGPAKLRAEYQKLAKQFHDSALTIRVQGHDDEEKRQFAIANKGDADLVYIVLADAIQSPKATPAQLKRLAEKVGEVQFGQILTAYHQASTEIPTVSADFLPKPSTQDDGGES